MHCDHSVHFSADLSLWLDVLGTLTPKHVHLLPTVFFHFHLEESRVLTNVETRVALKIQDRSPKSRPVSSLNQSQTQMTRPVATGLALQRALGETLKDNDDN